MGQGLQGLGPRAEKAETHMWTLVTSPCDSACHLGQVMWETPMVPLLQIWKRYGHRAPPVSCPCLAQFCLLVFCTRDSPCIVLICICELCWFPGDCHHPPKVGALKDTTGSGAWWCLMSSSIPLA